MRFILLVYLRHLCHTQYRATEGDKIYATARQCSSVFGAFFAHTVSLFPPDRVHIVGSCVYRRILCISRDRVHGGFSVAKGNIFDFAITGDIDNPGMLR